MSQKQIPDLGPIVRGRMPVMDGWRGLAIFVVVMHNAGYVLSDYPSHGTIPETLVGTLLDTGWVGVQLFFVLSGFLITGILLDTRESPRFFRDFYIRRALRIFPLYYAFLFVVLVVAPLLSHDQEWIDTVRAGQLPYWLYVSNWLPLVHHRIDALNHAWSLGVEEQFYLIWPVLVLLTGRRGFPLLVCAVILVAPVSRLLMHLAAWDPEYPYEFTFARADALAIGGAMALAARNPKWLRYAWRARSWILAITSIGLVALILNARGFPQYEVTGLLLGQTLIALWFGVLMLGSLAPERHAEALSATVLTSDSMRTLGKYSYAVYLFHFPLTLLLRPPLARLVSPESPVARLGIGLGFCFFILALSTLLAYGSWHLFEKRLLALKDRLAPRHSTASGAVAMVSP